MKIVSYRSKLPSTLPQENKNNLRLMLANLKCHLQFLEIYPRCTFCHIACISVLTEADCGLIERDRE